MSLVDRPIAPSFDPQIQVSLSNGRIVSFPMGVWLSAIISQLDPNTLAEVINKCEAINSHIVRI